MIDFGFDKLALIGAVSLIVLGPEKLPKVARTIGHLLGKAQRYVADVKAEVNRSIELEELKKMRGQFEQAARDVEQTVHQEVQSAQEAVSGAWSTPAPDYSLPYSSSYRAPRKNWRVKRTAKPLWFKQQTGVRRHVQSGAARVKRFRPPQYRP